ncbi:hypothetical protein BGZ63DRAFT_395123 [Mariannaea sp. PMI_226]|nr:hypothetical protein BGZ63DRAFT_395123 [Mariannaea sp. PMI_226]
MRSKTADRSSSLGSSSNCSSSSSSSEDSASTSVVTRRQPTRRVHSKSRLGCFSCKRRRVKCDERRPCCAPCSRLGLQCEYPPRNAEVHSTTTLDIPRPVLSSVALEDLRFHHQFLTVAYPSLPLRGDAIWSQCAAMTHEFDFLAHAALGLGASHLSQNGTGNYTAQALQHRVTAIRLINQQLSAPANKSLDQADALFAALICIVAQSCLIPHGMTEYLVMTRGATLVASSIMPDMGRSIFRTFSSEGHIEALSRMISDQTRDLSMIEGFHQSVLKLEPLCKQNHEKRYFQSLIRTIVSAPTSSFGAWREFVDLFLMPSLMSNEEFQSFIDPSSHVCQLLIIHMFLLDYVLGRSFISLVDEPKCSGRKDMVIFWTRNIINALPTGYQEYTPWLESFCETLSAQDARYLLSP